LFTEVLRDLVMQAIGLGLVLSLVFSETLGLAAGGMIVPGYVALMIHQPLRIIGTIVVSLATLGVLKGLSRYTFIYGRRRIVFTILIGFVLGWISRETFHVHAGDHNFAFYTIGIVIPGLIANWMDRQGVLPTLSMMLIAAVLVRLLLMIVSGGDVGLGRELML
jgi:poly-gamma-glutamate biosynthesis protein PgsC/CapC